MASKLGYLIGRTRVLEVEEAVDLVERLSKGQAVIPVTDSIGGYRYFQEIPGIRHMRFEGRGPWRLTGSFEPLALTATSVSEPLLGRLLDESPDELFCRIHILKSDKKLRGGYNAFSDADGSHLGITQGPFLRVSVSLDAAHEPRTGKWRGLLDRAGLDESKVLLSDSEGWEVFAEYRELAPLEFPLTEAPTMNQVLVEMPAFSGADPEARRGKLTGLSLFGHGGSGYSKSGEPWQQIRQIWAAWREALPGKFEFWDLSFNLSMDSWETGRAWINANLPGPFVGRLKGGTATPDVAGILREECEAGQYVEFCWKRVRGRVVIVAGIREKDGWRIQLSSVDPLNEVKAAAMREAFLKLACRDDLFAE